MADEAMGSGIGQRLRAARERAGLTREALAFHSGISWSAIAQVEAGRRVNLRPSTLSGLASALGVTIDYLVSSRLNGPMFEHRMLLYRSDEEFLEHAVDFLGRAVARSEAALAVTAGPRIKTLRARLGPAAERVEFREQRSWYATPVAALEGFREFVSRSLEAGAPWVRILGEPVWKGRSPSDVHLCTRTESLLNLTFSQAPVTLLCSYDARRFDAAIIEHARAVHPSVAGL